MLLSWAGARVLLPRTVTRLNAIRHGFCQQKRYIRLINVHTFELEDFHSSKDVKYAILSHRWEGEEVLIGDLQHLRLHQLRRMQGWAKIENSCRQAAADKIDYVWVDTCCIDKSSSAELQEAINSMYRWYQNADRCYAYLSDLQPLWTERLSVERSLLVRSDFMSTYTSGALGTALLQHWLQEGRPVQFLEAFVRSQWFKRGWTLQELLAPKKVTFFDADWNKFGTRSTLSMEIEHITKIPRSYLVSGFPSPARAIVTGSCVAEIMSWAGQRQTTRIEDRAYSLLGLFGVNMPMLYGEGDNSFLRLQNEILKKSDDQSIFAWQGVGSPSIRLLPFKTRDGSWFAPTDDDRWSPGLIARTPEAFPPGLFTGPTRLKRRAPLSVTNEGISLELKLVPYAPRIYIALLNIESFVSPTNGEDAKSLGYQGIFLKRLDAEGRYARISGTAAGHPSGADVVPYHSWLETRTVQRQVTVVRTLRFSDSRVYDSIDHAGFKLSKLPGLPPDAPLTRRRDHLSWTISGARYHSKTQSIVSVPIVSSPDLATSENAAAAAFGLVAVVSFHNPAGCDPVLSAPFGLNAIGFGFDFDFNPMCVFTARRDHNNDMDVWKDMFELSHNVHPSPRYENQDMSLKTENGTLRIIQDGYLAIKTTLAARDSGTGFLATLDLKKSNKITESFTLEMSRTRSDLPWDFRMIATW